ncbi:MAG: phosphoribosyltransferase family protein [Limnohabitans sp.]|nr:phosphoribosyltransferase family protein [Limnohabitans sp.]
MLKKLLNLFFPEICLGCSSLLLEQENSICIKCRHNIPYTNHHLNLENEAFKKFNGRLPLEFAYSLIYYHKKGIVQQLIHNLKYNNHQKIGTILGEWFSDSLKDIDKIKTVDYIIPVPLHKKRLKERGYNQVNTFCNTLSKNINKPVLNELLHRNEYTITQSKKKLTERNLVSKNTFECNFSEAHTGKHFLLIDDVLTTGATLEACGKAILEIPGAKISIITIAYSQS